jgi:riboflavin synthase
VFTGLIRHLGRVERLTRGGGPGRLVVDLGPVGEGAGTGDSIAVNGVCLTLTALSGPLGTFDVLDETLSRSTLGSLGPADRVNLEPSLRAGDPLGGHFVQGHVDGTGEVVSSRDLGGQWEVRVSAPGSVLRTCVEKGSIAIDGISLTIAGLGAESLTVAVIPETWRRTTLGLRKVGERVNLEADILGKVVARLLGDSGAGGLSMEKLRDAGW